MKLLLVLAFWAPAQFWDPPKKEEPAPPPVDSPDQPVRDVNAPPPDSSEEPPASGGAMDEIERGGEKQPDDAPPPPPNLNDARENFATVVETFLAQNTKEGVWNLRDKRAKKIRRLALVSIEPKTVRAGAKPGLFRGRVKFRDENGKPVLMEMTVDMTGVQWRVSGAKMLEGQK